MKDCMTKTKQIQYTRVDSVVTTSNKYYKQIQFITIYTINTLKMIFYKADFDKYIFFR